MNLVMKSIGAALIICGGATAQSTLPALDLDSDIPTLAPEIRGVVQSRDIAIIAATLSARVTKLPFREGEEFAKGDLLVAFDCSQIKAETEAAQAEAVAAYTEYKSNVELMEYDAAGSLEVKQSKARSQQTAAQVKAMKARVSRL